MDEQRRPGGGWVGLILIVLGFSGMIWVMGLPTATKSGEALGLLGWLGLVAVAAIGLAAVAWGTRGPHWGRPERNPKFKKRRSTL